MKAAATRLLPLLLLALPATAAQAERRVTAEEFEALSAGKTLSFTQNGTHYGAETYGSARQSLWQYLDGACVEGHWYPADDLICFVYDNRPGVSQCWIFEERGGAYFARTEGMPAGDPAELALSGISETPVACNAPDLGV